MNQQNNISTNPMMEDRCVERYNVTIFASLRQTNSKPFDIEICDISRAGFACKGVSGMPKGARCWVRIPMMGGLQAEVIWNTGAKIGCAFTDLLNQAVLQNIITRHPVQIKL
ncbi:hypothetical protein LPB140_06665 [Sphingorhabdus lutea]|uniref:PilZ domain-containing protein n=2 Tax=Sphingorhabdus lutea TaxID=1913578 RepID=A0A1L3JEV1_9SPHN|nr:hypothetical protein LPB140_06665 [Sphingorhabdus lutea]